MVVLKEGDSGWGISSSDTPLLEESPVVVGWGQGAPAEETPPVDETNAVDQA